MSIKTRSTDACRNYLTVIKFVPTHLWIGGAGVDGVEIEMWDPHTTKVVAFEPNPISYKSIENKQTPDRKIIEAALFDQDGNANLLYSHNWKNGGSLLRSGHWRSEKVKTVCLDTAITDTPEQRTAMLWLDCEGSELAALRGATQLLENKIAVINLEMTSLPREISWPSPISIDLFLRQHDFIHVWVHTIRPVIGQFDAIYLHKSLVMPGIPYCNPTAMISANQFNSNLPRGEVRSWS